MLIRRFAEPDVDALRELWRASWRASYGPALGPAADAVIAASLDGDAIRTMFADDGGCLLAVEGAAVLGSVCFAERGAVAYVWGMYVRPDRQRVGIGTALIRHAAGAFASAEWIQLSAVDDRALAFYRKLGFADRGPGEIDLFPTVRVPSTRLAARAGDIRVSSPPAAAP